MRVNSNVVILTPHLLNATFATYLTRDKDCNCLMEIKRYNLYSFIKKLGTRFMLFVCITCLGLITLFVIYTFSDVIIDRPYILKSWDNLIVFVWQPLFQINFFLKCILFITYTKKISVSQKNLHFYCYFHASTDLIATLNSSFQIYEEIICHLITWLFAIFTNFAKYNDR